MGNIGAKLQKNWIDVYTQRFLRVGTLGGMAVHVFRRPIWTFLPENKDWADLHLYPSFGFARLEPGVSYFIEFLLQLFIGWCLWTTLDKPILDLDRRNLLMYFAAPICGIKVMSTFVQVCLLLVGDLSSEFSLSPLEAVLMIVCEPFFDSSLYRTMYSSLSYFCSLMFLLVVVILAWSVLAMLVINIGRTDPDFASLKDTSWEMLTILNTADWPNPVIPSYEANTAFFLFFIAYSVVVDWGFLNLVLGLVVAFFEASWLNKSDDVEHEKVATTSINPMIQGNAERAGGGVDSKVSAIPVVEKGIETFEVEQRGSPISPVRTSHNFTTSFSLCYAGKLFGRQWQERVGPIVESHAFDLATDFILFVIGLTFVFSHVPLQMLNLQVALNSLELFLRISVRKATLWEWLHNFRNLSNALLIVILFVTSMTFFYICGPQGRFYRTVSCQHDVLNDTLNPLMAHQVVLAVMIIRACILFRISLLVRDFGYDYIPVRWQKQIERARKIVLETSTALSHLVIMLLTLMYIFSSIGCEIWGGLLSRNPDLPGYNTLMASEYVDEDYWPLNFNDMGSAFTTMFTLLYINNMQIITSGCSAVSSKHSRWFFGAFYVIGVLFVRNIFTSFLWSRIGKILNSEADPIKTETVEEYIEDKVSKQGICKPQVKMKSKMTKLRGFVDIAIQAEATQEIAKVKEFAVTQILQALQDEKLFIHQRVALVIISAKAGHLPNMAQNRLTLWAFKLRSQLRLPVLVCCWLLTFVRLFQTPPWVLFHPEEHLGDFHFSSTPRISPELLTIIKMPLLLMLGFMLVLEATSDKSNLSRVVVCRFALMTNNFVGIIITLITGTTSNRVASRMEYYLSFCSILYTFWFDHNALQRIKIVFGVVPKLVILCIVFLIFTMLMAMYGDFMFGLIDLDVGNDDYDSQYYRDYAKSVWTTAVTITSSSFPSQFIPILEAYKEYSFYLVLLIGIGGFVILEGSIAVVNTEYQRGVQFHQQNLVLSKQAAVRNTFFALDKARKLDCAESPRAYAAAFGSPLGVANLVKPATKSSGVLSVVREVPIVSPEQVDEIFKEMFENYREYSKFGSRDAAQRAILRTILDLDGDGKIGAEDYDLVMHVMRTSIKPVSSNFLTAREKFLVKDMKHRILLVSTRSDSNVKKLFAISKLYRESLSAEVRHWASTNFLRNLEKKHWDALVDSLSGCLSVLSVLGRGSITGHREFVVVLLVFFMLEFMLKWFLLGLKSYFRGLRNRIDFGIGFLMIIFVLVGDSKGLLFKGEINFWSVGLDIIQMLRLLLYPRNIACFASPVNGIAWKDVMKTIAKLSFSFAEVFICVSFTYAQLGVVLFGGDIPKHGINALLDQKPFGHYNFYILNFNDMTSGLFTLFCCLRVSDWDVVSNGFSTTSSNFARIYFVGWYTVGVLLMFNILKSYFIVVFRHKSSTATSLNSNDTEAQSESERNAARNAEVKAAAFDAAELNALDEINVNHGFIVDLDYVVFGKSRTGKSMHFMRIASDEAFMADLRVSWESRGSEYTYASDTARSSDMSTPRPSSPVMATSEKVRDSKAQDQVEVKEQEETAETYWKGIKKKNKFRYKIKFPFKNKMDPKDRLKILRRIRDLVSTNPDSDPLHQIPGSSSSSKSQLGSPRQSQRG